MRTPRDTTSWTRGRVILRGSFKFFLHVSVRSRIIRCRKNFFQNVNPSQQKCRLVLITSQEKLDEEINNFLHTGHHEKLEDRLDRYFISPIVITVKKDSSVKSHWKLVN